MNSKLNLLPRLSGDARFSTTKGLTKKLVWMLGNLRYIPSEIPLMLMDSWLAPRATVGLDYSNPQCLM